jgi:UDP-N-acetylglucosamine:LPS N-acetylglucosamine transferase
MNAHPVSIFALLLLACAGVMARSWLIARKRAKASWTLPAGSSSKVLILTAAVGGGHEAAGRTVRAELERSGYTVAMEDGLREMSRALDWLLVRGYRRQVTGVPRTLGAIFAVTALPVGAATIRLLTGLPCAGRLLRILEKERPGLVISTYPLVTSALGRLRKGERLRVPAVAVVPDYGVHPLWVHTGMDLHLVVSGPSAVLAERAGGVTSVVRMPVAPAFRTAPARKDARAILGLPGEGFVILIVGGAWGIGNLGEAARCAVGLAAHTIVVTGNNVALERRLAAEFADAENVWVLGWRDDLPIFMAAADCLIQNAGGMTCIEAIETGLPILMFDPIRGHGEFNASVMDRAGVVRLVRSERELAEILRSASRGEIRLPAPRPEPSVPTISEAVAYLVPDSPPPVVVPRSPFPSPRPALLAGVVVLASFLWMAFASPGVALAARELHLRIPGYAPSPGKVSLGVKVDDPATAAALEGVALRKRVPITIFSTSRGAGGLRPAEDLTFGVAEKPAGTRLMPLSERREDRDIAAEIQRATGTYPAYFLAAPRTDLAAFAEAPPDTKLVMPEQAGEGLRPGLLIVDSSGLGPVAATQRFTQTLQQTRSAGLRCVPLSQL